jgi:hypothetical protein
VVSGFWFLVSGSEQEDEQAAEKGSSPLRHKATKIHQGRECTSCGLCAPSSLRVFVAMDRFLSSLLEPETKDQKTRNHLNELLERS